MRQKILLVEGAEENHVVYHLCRRHQLSRFIDQKIWHIDVQPGVENVLQNIPVYLRLEKGLTHLGILVDADLDVPNRWQALGQRLQSAGDVTLPPEPNPAGSILTLHQGYRDIQVGLWLMPDNREPGTLENFIQHFPLSSEKLTHPAWRNKAELHTWLAWQDEPGRPIGQAITKGFLNPESVQAQSFIRWLKTLFDVESSL